MAIWRTSAAAPAAGHHAQRLGACNEIIEMSVERPELEAIVLPRRPGERTRRHLVRYPDGRPGELGEVIAAIKRRAEIARHQELEAQRQVPHVLPDLRALARDRTERSK